MKVIDCSPLHEKGASSGLLNQMRAFLLMGSTWQKDQQAQESFITHIHKQLGNNYTLIRNAALPDLDIPIPLVLVGPSGVWAIYASSVKGIYRARGDAWLVLDDHSNRYRHAQPNLLTRALLIARAVHTYLLAQGHGLMEVEPVLYLSDPGIHVDADRPAVRLVRNDTLGRFVTSITQSTPSLDSNQVFEIVKALTKPPAAQPKRKSASIWVQPWRIGPLQMIAWQWLVLGAMFLIEACLIGGAIYLVLTTL
jgi:hypothetical protein